MASASNVQTSFHGGEWSAFAQGRMEDPRYKTALDLLQNAYPIEEGAAPRRPGTAFAATTRGGAPGRLLLFDFETVTPYNMEFTDGHLRFFSGINLIADNPSVNATTISITNPAQVTVDAATTWATGDQVEFTFEDVVAASTLPLLANRQFTITVIDPQNFTIADGVSGQSVDGLAVGWTAGLNLSVARVTDIATPYVNQSWSTLRSVQTEVQNGNTTIPTAVLLHGSYPPEALTATVASGQGTIFAMSPAQFKDGPYLDPFPNSTITPDALTGLVNLSLGFAAYDTTKAYAIGDYATSASLPYVSLQNANLNNTPASSPTFWAPSSFGAVISANGFTFLDIGRHVRIFSEPLDWNTATTYSTGNVVKFNNAYWTALGAMAGATPATGSINPNQPGNLTTTWSPNPTGGRWTWGVITALSTSGLVPSANGVIIGNAGNAQAAFDDITVSNNTAGNSGRSVAGAWIGKGFATPQVITSARVTAQGFDTVDLASCQFQLFGKHTAPSSAGDGTQLCPTQYCQGNFTGSLTFIPTNPTIAWEYCWIVQTDVRSNADLFTHIAEIQFYTGNNPVGSGVQLQLRGDPLLYTTAASTWRLGLFNATDPKYPASGCWHEGRLWLAGAVANRFDASNSNDPFNFAPTNPAGAVGASNAISYTLNSSTQNKIFWMSPDLQGIVAGTLGGEWLISAPAQGSLAPTNIRAVRMTKYGSANIEPRRTGLTTVFVQKYRHKLLEYLADAFSGKFYGPNLSEFAKHLVKPGISEIAYQEELNPIVWVRLDDGSLAGITYRRIAMLSSQPPQFWGWHRHVLGSGHTVESISSGPSVDGTLDTLALITHDPEANQRHVEILTTLFDEDASIMDAWFLDDAVVPTSATTVNSGAAIRLDGLWHLNGEIVQVWAGGLDLGNFVVSNGAVTVPYGSAFDTANAGLFTFRYLTELATKGPFKYGCALDRGSSIPIVVGHTYTTRGQVLRPVEPAAVGTQNGPGFAKTRRNHAFGVLAEGAQGVSFGTDFDHMRPALFAEDGGRVLSPTELFSGLWRDRIDDTYDFNGQLAWEITRPYPATITAIGGFVQGQDI